MRIIHAECARFPKQRSSTSGKSDLRRGPYCGRSSMYKRLIFRYKGVLIKTQRDDKGGCVCGLIRRPLSFKVVIIGKSVIAFNSRNEWESASQDKGNTDSSAFEKSLVEEHFFSVPQTDTGAPVVDHQGKRATVVQGTRQQKLGVTFGRCPSRRKAGHSK